MAYKVLVVDDEIAVRELLRDLLRKESCQVRCCASAEETLEILKKEYFDAVLLDIKLPGMSGLEALRKIKELRKDTVVIMITGFGYDEELISKSRDYGCSGYIGKNMPVAQIVNSFKLFMKSAKKKRTGNL